MKRLSLIILALLTLLFAQCKKEKIDNTNGSDVKKVKVRCQVPMGNGEKTDFNNLMTDGSIKWSTGTERIYLVVNGDKHQIIEFTATATEPGATFLFFEGEVPEDIIEIGQNFDIWYFGNSHKLETPYVNKTESNGVITQIDGSIATQSGNLSDLGYHHIAKGTAHFETTNGEITLEVNEGLINQIAIAYMDLTDVTKLVGTAIVGTSYSLQYNETSGQYDFIVSEDKVINITNNNTAPTESFVVLLPNDVANVEIINNNDFRYVFKNGIEKNNIYHSSSNDNNIVTLSWEYYPYSNGHEFVDLGLPSGTKWAKYNIGVNPEQLTNAADYYGDHFVWGNIVDVHENDDLSCELNDIQGTDKDAAKAIWGGNWVMPNQTEMEELLNKCTWTHVDEFGEVNVEGWIATSTINDESIFFPGAGYYETHLNSKPVFADNKKIYYWTSINATYNNVKRAIILKQNANNESELLLTEDYARDARSIRPVLKPIN